MKRNARRLGDRTAVTAVGVAALAVATLVLLLATGVLHHLGRFVDADRPLLDARLDRSLAAYQTAWQLGTVGVGVVLIALGLWWLRHQLPAQRKLHDITFADLGDGTPGDTTINGRALANGFEADLQRHADVIDARVDVLLDSGLVRVMLTAPDDVDVEQLTTDAVGPAIARLARVADIDTLPAAQIDIRLRPRKGRNLD